MQPTVGGKQYGLQSGPYLAKGGVPPGWGQVTPGIWPGMGILWRTGVAQVRADAGLAQDWPREPDASAKEAQVSQPGGVASRKERWRC